MQYWKSREIWLADVTILPSGRRMVDKVVFDLSENEYPGFFVVMDAASIEPAEMRFGPLFTLAHPVIVAKIEVGWAYLDANSFEIVVIDRRRWTPREGGL